MPRSHCATVFGSNRTHVPMRNDGIRPAFACLKIVILETVNMLASSSAVIARPIRSIRSGSDIGSAELFWGLHECIYLLCGFTSAATAAYCCRTCAACNPCAVAQGSRRSAPTRGIRHIYRLDLLQTSLISRLPESESISVWGASRGLLTTNGKRTESVHILTLH